MADARSHWTQRRKDACNSLSQAGKSQLQHPWAAGQIQPTNLVCLARKLLAHRVLFQNSNKLTRFKIQHPPPRKIKSSCFLENRSPGSLGPTFRHSSRGLAKAAAALPMHTTVPPLRTTPTRPAPLLHSLLILAWPARLPGQSAIFN